MAGLSCCFTYFSPSKDLLNIIKPEFSHCFGFAFDQEQPHYSVDNVNLIIKCFGSKHAS